MGKGGGTAGFFAGKPFLRDSGGADTGDDHAGVVFLENTGDYPFVLVNLINKIKFGLGNGM